MVLYTYLRWQLSRLVCYFRGHVIEKISASTLHVACMRCGLEMHRQWRRHEGQREKVRRAKQVLKGQLPVDYEVRLSMQAAYKRFVKRMQREVAERSQRRG